MKYYLCLLLLLLSTAAHAGSKNSLYTVVGFHCDRSKDILLVTYDGGYDHYGENLVRNMKPDHWDLWSFYYSGQTVTKQCRLSDGEYELTLSLYRSGSCDLCYGIWAKVTRGDKLLFDEGLDGFEGPPTQTVITQLIIKIRDAEPELAKLTWDEFVEQAQFAK